MAPTIGQEESDAMKVVLSPKPLQKRNAVALLAGKDWCSLLSLNSGLDPAW
jgi:hypothetical protein